MFMNEYVALSRNLSILEKILSTVLSLNHLDSNSKPYTI